MKRLCIAVAFAIACVAPSSSAARTSFSGNACSLLTANQVAAFGVPAKCTPRSVNGNGITSHFGTWGTPQAAHVTVSIVTYGNPTLFNFAKAHLTTLPGHAKKVAGIGSLAYESGGDGGSLAAMNFLVGRTICAINMRTAKPLKSLAQFNAMAKSIAGKL